MDEQEIQKKVKLSELLIRAGASEPKPDRSKWEKRFGPYTVRYERRHRTEFMGRFGGGWQWALGFEASGRSKYGWSIHLMLLVASLTIRWNSPFYREFKERQKVSQADADRFSLEYDRARGK